MVKKVRAKFILGEVAGYAFGWNPWKLSANVIVKVGKDKIRIPVDQRQVKFIKKEYPVGGMVDLYIHHGKWHIKSHPAPIECDIDQLLKSVY